MAHSALAAFACSEYKLPVRDAICVFSGFGLLTTIWAASQLGIA